MAMDDGKGAILSCWSIDGLLEDGKKERDGQRETLRGLRTKLAKAPHRRAGRKLRDGFRRSCHKDGVREKRRIFE